MSRIAPGEVIKSSATKKESTTCESLPGIYWNCSFINNLYNYN